MQNAQTPKPSLTIPVGGSSNEYWRFERPVWNTDKCIRCGACYLACPDGAIVQTSEGYYDADPRLCKGCGICKQQCWTGCISLETCDQRPPWVVLVQKIIP